MLDGMKTRIPIKKYVMDVQLPWEARYQQLEQHHLEETAFLIRRIEELEAELERSISRAAEPK
jgi:hypothetical protein